ncbi:MAG: TetR family transcriptional regulator C-terminal domain-containing protein [Deltaproteobacteria bacterium]|nr:TetR family transcriptional regulator C-terminal domain-containing protein [Deltaproteobacteria bacterium]MBW2693311.1 TetR family transcriptional regulator C-terminal domain-containing protein [Deltaproteobacteria bacterium]
MTQSQPQTAPLSRAEGKQRSRQKLITATINSIAKRGFADTTLARVAEGAGLSRGIVNFHFRTKDALFLETLKFMSREYRECWFRALDESGPSPAEKLEAVLMAEFEPPISNRNRMAVWFAFYGEAKSRPTYMSSCTELDDIIHDTLINLCRTIIEEGDYENRNADIIAFGISSLTEGLTLDILLNTGAISLDRGKEVLRSHLQALFPKHFPITRCTGN